MVRFSKNWRSLVVAIHGPGSLRLSLECSRQNTEARRDDGMTGTASSRHYMRDPIDIQGLQEIMRVLICL